MSCGCTNSIKKQPQSHQGFCCGGHEVQRHGMWSKKKKIRVLEAQLKDLNEQKIDIEDLIEELKVDA